MSVTFIVTGNNTEIPPHIASAITDIRAVGGPGRFSRVMVNGITFRREIQFQQSASLIPNEGIFADGKLLKKLRKGDEWFIGEIEAVRTIYLYNYEEARKAWKGANMPLY